MKKRMLVISWYFPPINSSEGLVTYKLLNNSSLQYDVFTQKNNESWSYGKSEDLKVGKNIERIYADTDNLNNYLVEAVDYFKNNIDKYDVVMTRSMPEVSHEIGLKIKELKPEIVWIASFGDPIANNPFTLMTLKYDNMYDLSHRYERKMSIREILSPKRILKSCLYKHRYKGNFKLIVGKNNDLQKKIVNNCDYVICNSVNERDYMLKDYSNKDDLEKKVIVLPHTFDSNLYTNKKKKNDKIVFSFIGHLDDIRTPHTLFEAILKLRNIDKDIVNKVEFNFYGNLSDKEKIFLFDNEMYDLVKKRKPVDYLKSLEIMEESDWLIHIDANISDILENNIFFAAKIADYIGAKSNIIGITMVNGPSADILRNYNALCLENNVDEIFNYLYLIIYKDYNIKLNEKYREEFDAKNVSKDFDKFINKL